MVEGRKVLGFDSVSFVADGLKSPVLQVSGQQVRFNNRRLDLDPVGKNRVELSRHFGDDMFVEVRLKESVIKVSADHGISLEQMSKHGWFLTVDGKRMALQMDFKCAIPGLNVRQHQDGSVLKFSPQSQILMVVNSVTLVLRKPKFQVPFTSDMDIFPLNVVEANDSAKLAQKLSAKLRPKGLSKQSGKKKRNAARK